MFVLNSIFNGHIDNYIDFFSSKTQNRTDILPQFLAPFIGILKNIYDAVNEFGVKDNEKFDNLADILTKTDAFEIGLF